MGTVGAGDADRTIAGLVARGDARLKIAAGGAVATGVAVSTAGAVAKGGAVVRGGAMAGCTPETRANADSGVGGRWVTEEGCSAQDAADAGVSVGVGGRGRAGASCRSISATLRGVMRPSALAHALTTATLSVGCGCGVAVAGGGCCAAREGGSEVGGCKLGCGRGDDSSAVVAVGAASAVAGTFDITGKGGGVDTCTHVCELRASPSQADRSCRSTG